MTQLEIWVVYNKTTGRIDVIKSKRFAVRIAITYEKLYGLLNNNQKVICTSSDDFFSNYEINKENIYFNWNASQSERMMLYKQFFKRRDMNKYD